MDAEAAGKVCRIEEALGRDELCPGAACAFWEPGKAGGCPFDRVDFADRADLAEWLHDLRTQLEEFGHLDADEARREFFERLNAAEDGE